RRLRRILPKRRHKPIAFGANMSQADFEKMVMRTKEYIRAGDIVQAVISQRWETRIQTAPFEIYRALRVINPSPYMYYLRIGGVELVGSSPETLVRCEEGRVSIRPIAGPTRRGPYAGAVGYFSFSGNMDTCINIRTIVIKDRRAYIQAGAGIVADSDPEREYEETCNKARAMMKAIELAEQGLE